MEATSIIHSVVIWVYRHSGLCKAVFPCMGKHDLRLNRQSTTGIGNFRTTILKPSNVLVLKKCLGCQPRSFLIDTPTSECSCVLLFTARLSQWAAYLILEVNALSQYLFVEDRNMHLINLADHLHVSTEKAAGNFLVAVLTTVI